MKKIFLLLLYVLSLSAYSADSFNTLDTNGSITVNAGTNLNTSALALDSSITAVTGSKAAGMAAASAVLGGGVYNSTLPAPSTGQQTALQVDATGRLRVNASEVASGATDSGNPIKIGGVYNSTLPTFTTGQRGDIQIGTRGGVRVELYASDSATPIAVTSASADAGGAATGYISHVRAESYNGTAWDRIRSGIIIPSATLTGFQNSLPWAIYNATPTARTEGQGGPLQSDSAGSLQVVSKASSGTMTDRSGTITSGGTAQTIMTANASRKYLLIQNSSDTAMWCNFTTTAVASQPSFTLIAGASFVMENNAVSTEAISCIGATTGKIFTAKEM